MLQHHLWIFEAVAAVEDGAVIAARTGEGNGKPRRIGPVCNQTYTVLVVIHTVGCVVPDQRQVLGLCASPVRIARPSEYSAGVQYPGDDWRGLLSRHRPNGPRPTVTQTPTEAGQRQSQDRS